MPSDEEVTQRAGSLGSMTGWTAAACTALLPDVGQALVTYLQDHTLMGSPAQAAATGRMTPVLSQRWPIRGSSS